MNAQPQEIPQTIHLIEANRIERDPDQPRKIFNAGALTDLAADIKARGIKQPITVRSKPEGNGYIIVIGERRHRAACLAGLKKIPCMIELDDVKPLDRLIDQVSENLNRDNLKPLELAAFFNRLVDDHGIAVKDVPGLLQQHGLKAMTRSYVSNLRRLTELPGWAQKWINDGTITASHGKHLLTAKGFDDVLDDLHKQFNVEITRNDMAPKTAELPGLIWDTFQEFYTCLDQYPKSYDRSACTHCPKSKSLTDGDGETTRFCLDESCLTDKVKAAKQAAQTPADSDKKTPAQTPAQNTSDAQAKPGKAEPAKNDKPAADVSAKQSDGSKTKTVSQMRKPEPSAPAKTEPDKKASADDNAIEWQPSNPATPPAPVSQETETEPDKTAAPEPLTDRQRLDRIADIFRQADQRVADSQGRIKMPRFAMNDQEFQAAHDLALDQ